MPLCDRYFRLSYSFYLVVILTKDIEVIYIYGVKVKIWSCVPYLYDITILTTIFVCSSVPVMVTVWYRLIMMFMQNKTCTLVVTYIYIIQRTSFHKSCHHIWTDIMRYVTLWVPSHYSILSPSFKVLGFLSGRATVLSWWWEILY